jgi:hypothetical protein
MASNAAPAMPARNTRSLEPAMFSRGAYFSS